MNKLILLKIQSLKSSDKLSAVNKYVEENEPWKTIKEDLEKTRTTLTAVINAVKVLTIYLKPILPE